MKRILNGTFLKLCSALKGPKQILKYDFVFWNCGPKCSNILLQNYNLA